MKLVEWDDHSDIDVSHPAVRAAPAREERGERVGRLRLICGSYVLQTASIVGLLSVIAWIFGSDSP